MAIDASRPALDRLKTRIQGLRSKTTDNGRTEAEALLAATKVAELLDLADRAAGNPPLFTRISSRP